jgi:hypothetical protein
MAAAHSANYVLSMHVLATLYGVKCGVSNPPTRRTLARIEISQPWIECATAYQQAEVGDQRLRHIQDRSGSSCGIHRICKNCCTIIEGRLIAIWPQTTVE